MNTWTKYQAIHLFRLGPELSTCCHFVDENLRYGGVNPPSQPFHTWLQTTQVYTEECGTTMPVFLNYLQKKTGSLRFPKPDRHSPHLVLLLEQDSHYWYDCHTCVHADVAPAHFPYQSKQTQHNRIPIGCNSLPPSIHSPSVQLTKRASSNWIASYIVPSCLYRIDAMLVVHSVITSVCPHGIDLG